jgi:DNA mismatch repair protein MutS
MGKRFLREQILHPLQNQEDIQKRQNYIHAFSQDTILLEKVRKQLRSIADIDAILTRLSLERATPRDLLALKKSLIAIREVRDTITSSQNTTLQALLQ